MSVTDIHAAGSQLSTLIARALAGEEILIASAGTPVVKLVPVAPTTIKTPRGGGQLRGTLWIADDFDELPPEIAEASRDKTPREGGQWHGKVWMADDFDELPPDIAAAFGMIDE